MAQLSTTITGRVSVESRHLGRVWVAEYRLAGGGRTRKVLGSAWAKDSGRKTARGAVIWRTPAGPKPDGHLTPREAQAELEVLLAEQRAVVAGLPDVPVKVTAGSKTFADAVEAWLAYVADEKQLAPSTLRSYRGIARTHLLPEFKAGTRLRRVTAERIVAWTPSALSVRPLGLTGRWDPARWRRRPPGSCSRGLSGVGRGSR
ncbi:hypothetical protein [Baekduia alba]|uniref:hypothetical protein n=1 Tax=Baekduia alba TaxID=2997333 RepID=UPI003D78BB82